MSIISLKKLGRVIDDQLEKLERTWETPHMLLSNTEAPNEEAQGLIESFLVSINKVHDELNELVEEQKESTADVDRFNETLVSESSILKDDELEQRTQNLSLLDDEIAFHNFKNYSAPVGNVSDYDYEDDSNQELGDKENAEKLKPTCIPTPVIRLLTRVKDQDVNLTPSRKNNIGCEKKDVLERMNYLYQASKLVSKHDTITASCFGNAMISCSRKAVLRIETDLKRSICKCCQSPLIPGETSRVRLITKPIKAVKTTCLICKTSKKIPTKPGYKLWTENPDSINQIFNYTPKIKQSHSLPAEVPQNGGQNKMAASNIEINIANPKIEQSDSLPEAEPQNGGQNKMAAGEINIEVR
ncbi:Similar to RPP21: Ribonuclease P protein subunit p21 (Macaca mulatta), partial [Cotesia congregata]